MKTHRGAAARFEVTRRGKLTRRSTKLNHILEKKTASTKRRLARKHEVAAGDRRAVRRMLGI